MRQYNPTPEALQHISRYLALKYEVLPLAVQDRILHLLACHSLSANAIWDLMFITECIIRSTVISRDELRDLIEKYLPQDSLTSCATHLEDTLFESKEQISAELKDELRSMSESSVIGNVNTIISQAVTMQASDIHFEPTSDGLRIRFRVDGVLQTMRLIDDCDKLAVPARLKLMAGMDIAEKRKPQDGRIRMERLGVPLDIRVSSIPTPCGEKLVLRILDTSEQVKNLTQLGMSDTDLALVKRHLSNPQGMILVTGPTGSGKTTTLYGALSHLCRPEVNIMTIEDPIEYEIAGVTQSQIKPEIEYEFSTALRAFLRQDPDIIMVGEIRDFETAQIALRAAMTGHLVLSSVHTNAAPATITRLIDLGVEPYLVASSLTLVIAQRLVRRLCPRCKKPDEAANYKAGNGCGNCNHSGYRGRIGIFELLEISDELRLAIQRREPSNELERLGRVQGASTLSESGNRLVVTGETSIEELRRVLGCD